MAPQLGQEAILNGKPVRWSGDDYGWQSTASYDKLDKKGEFKLGSSLARRAAQAFEQAEDFRHSVFGTPSPDSVSGRIISKLDSLVEAFPLTQGEDIAMGHAGDLAGKLGISPALGALALGTVLPGPGEGKAVSRVGKAGRKGSRISPERAARIAQEMETRPVVRDPATGKRTSYGTVDQGGRAWIRDKGKNTYTLQTGEDIVGNQGPINDRSGYPTPRPHDPNARYPQQVPDPNTGGFNQVRSQLPLNNEAVNLNTRSTTTGPGMEPSTSRGNGPEPARVFKPDDLPRKELDIPDVKPSDLAKPRGDGNQYGNFEQVAGLREGWGRSGGQFITDNQQARRQGRDKTRQIAVDKQTPNFDEVRSQVDWADGDPDKLDAIARRLGVEPNKYASKTKTAILKRLNKLENDPKARKALEADWDWENLRGEDLTEARRLSELATERKGELVRPQVGEYFQGADVPRNIQDRLDNLANDGQRPSQARSHARKRNNERGFDDRDVPVSRTTERAEELTVKSDKEILENIEKYLDVPESARDHRRRVRSQRPLRDRSLRTK